MAPTYRHFIPPYAIVIYTEKESMEAYFSIEKMTTFRCSCYFFLLFFEMFPLLFKKPFA